MFMFNGQILNINVDLVIGEGDEAITYPAASLQNQALRDYLGITEVPDPPRPDDRIYYVTQNPDGSYSTVPKPASQTYGAVWTLIQGERGNRKLGGFEVGSKWFQSDADSRIQYLALKDKCRDLLAAGGVATDPVEILGVQIEWATMDDTIVPLTIQTVLDIMTKAGELDAELFIAARTHKAAMEQVENPFNYIYNTTLWPGRYQDTLPFNLQSGQPDPTM